MSAASPEGVEQLGLLRRLRYAFLSSVGAYTCMQRSLKGAAADPVVVLVSERTVTPSMLLLLPARTAGPRGFSVC